MELKKVAAIRTEFYQPSEDWQKKLRVELYDTMDELRTIKEKENTLLIAARDETIALGKQLQIAVMAYANPDFSEETYRGVDMLVEGFEEVDVQFLERVYQREHHIPWTIATTERCVIRELTLEDLDDLFALYAEDGMTDYTEPLYPYEEEKAYQRAYIDNMYRYFGYGLWLVYSAADHKLIGRAGLEHREYHGETELELGYLIGKPYQGKGYGTEIGKAILDYAKAYTGFERINTLIEDGNAASEKLSKKLGFEHMEDFVSDGKIMHRFVKEL